MATSQEYEHAYLNDVMECKICSKKLLLPKQLACGHTFCNICLEDVLKFNEDGSANVVCPLKCEIKTYIDKDKTTASLPTDHALKGILDLLSKSKSSSTEEVEKVKCQQTKNCEKPISHSCKFCSSKICTDCWSLHSCEEKVSTSITFNEKSGEIQPFCKDHNTVALYCCLLCKDRFICVYCMHRQHKNHEIKSVDEYGMLIKNSFVSKIKEWQENEEKKLQDMSTKYNQALSDLATGREALVDELRKRKLVMLEQCMATMNEEENQLLETFDQLFSRSGNF